MKRKITHFFTICQTFLLLTIKTTWIITLKRQKFTRQTHCSLSIHQNVLYLHFVTHNVSSKVYKKHEHQRRRFEDYRPIEISPCNMRSIHPHTMSVWRSLPVRVWPQSAVRTRHDKHNYVDNETLRHEHCQSRLFPYSRLPVFHRHEPLGLRPVQEKIKIEV